MCKQSIGKKSIGKKKQNIYLHLWYWPSGAVSTSVQTEGHLPFGSLVVRPDFWSAFKSSMSSHKNMRG